MNLSGGGRWLTQKGWTALVSLVSGLLLAGVAAAHPLGQNAFNRDAAILVEPDRIKLEYLLDLAEIPTLSAGEEADTDKDGQISDTEWAAYADRWSATLPKGLAVTVAGQPVTWTLTEHDWAIAPGQSGLLQLRLLARLEAPVTLAAQAAPLEYRDQTLADRLGWKEVWFKAGSGVVIAESNVADADRTKSMTDFTPRPEGPPSLLSARALVSLAKPVSAGQTSGPETTSSAHLLSIGAKLGSAQPQTTAQNLSLWAFFKLGVEHIAAGWDHLMFLLGLVLMSRGMRQLAITVTAFTVAHSVTLCLAAFDLVSPPGNWVEALIAATIAYVGVVALSGWKNNHGPFLAFGFGLIHGFGFAGALAQTLGSKSNLHLTGLLSFNLGIEAFQLSLVALVVPALHTLSNRSWYGWFYAALASGVILAGSSWFLFRTVGDGALGLTGLGLVIAALIAFLVLSRRRLQAAATG